MQNTHTQTTETTLASSSVKIYTINHNEVKPLSHLKANDSDYWRNFTMIGYSSYSNNSPDLRILAVKFSDTINMIEMNGLQFKDVVDLLRKHSIIYNNNMLDESYLSGGYFHFSQEREYSSTKSINESFENLYVTFRGLRLISDLINKSDGRKNLIALLYANDAKHTSVRSAYDDNII